MKTTMPVALLGLALLAMLGSPAATRGVAQSRAIVRTSPIVVVVSRELGVRDISMALLRRAFGGDLTELNGHRLVPFNYAAGVSIRQAFDRSVMGWAPDLVGRYWIDRRIRGQGLPPRIVPSEVILRGVVARLPGAIGYLTAHHLDGSVVPLTIDGRDYSDASYVLRAQEQ